MTEEFSPYPEVYKLLATPEAERLAELYLLQGDLNAAYDTFDLYFSKNAATDVPKAGDDAIISASLFRDGILLFTSCFSTKDAGMLHPDAVYGHLGADRKEYAQKLLDLRDCFVAHNFGPQRQHSIVIVCLEIDGKLVPAAFTQYFVRFVGWVAQERQQLLSFIDVARDHLKGLIEEAESAVMDQVMVITPEELAALPDAEVAIPAASDFRSSRSRFQKSGRGLRMPVPQRQLGRTSVLGS